LDLSQVQVVFEQAFSGILAFIELIEMALDLSFYLLVALFVALAEFHELSIDSPVVRTSDRKERQEGRKRLKPELRNEL
jgi:hypothetical protein